MTHSSLCIDIDNVLCDTDTVIREVIRVCTNGRVNLWYADIVEFDYHRCSDSSGQAISRDEWVTIHEEFSKPENILRIEPYPEIGDCIHRLAERFEIQFVTSRLSAAHDATRAWLDEQTFGQFRLEFAAHRTKHASETPYFAAIEDDREQAELFVPAVDRVVLLAHPWNELSADSSIARLENWPAITDFFLDSR